MTRKRIFTCCLSILFLLSLNSCTNKPAVEKPTITIWHWMTDRQDAFQKLANQYEQKTGIKVNFELYAPSDAYTQKVRAAAQGKTLPDIYGLLSEKRDFASFIKSQHVADLTAELEKDNSVWKKIFFEKALAVNEFEPKNIYDVKPGIYGIPIDVMTIEMLYNKNLFKKAGLNPENPPKTWAEFIAVGRRLKDFGIQGLVSGWGEIWMIDCFASNYAFNIMGKDKVLATIKGDIAYTDPDWIKVFSLFKEMKDAGILAGGLVTMVNKTAEQLFANEKAAFAFNGSWCVNVYTGMNPDLNYAAILPPAVSDKFPMMIWGGAGSSFLVNERSTNKQRAIEFLRWFTDRDQQVFLSRETKNLPSNKDALSGVPKILAQFADDMDYTTHPSIWGVSEFPVVIEAFDKGIQSIIIGEKTPEGLAKELQEIKKRELNKAKARK
ncbi:MAG: extracellular solute-binding protein [Candidatus Omnitrophota bacterium]|nr:extracellular solute-binding protein [Candidatus Omnitrophota bacterium]